MLRNLMPFAHPARASQVQALTDAGILGGIVLAAALFGIFTRPTGLLASFWPANAVMLGVLVRFPRFATPVGWAGATAGYILADLLTGSTLFSTALLTAANLIGVLAGNVLFNTLPPEDRKLERPVSVLFLTLVALGASAAAGVVGAAVGPVIFGGSAIRSFFVWSVTEFVNYVVILPVLLTLPPLARLPDLRSIIETPVFLLKLAPLAALLASLTASLLVGGPGAVAFPVLALLWCAVTYDRFLTAILTLLFSVWTLTIISSGYLTPEITLDNPQTLLSIRVAVALMVLAPITIASVMTQRNQLLGRLQRLATRDHLTDALNRGAFHEEASRLMAQASHSSTSMSILMLDIDHFKAINDTHGHAIGDLVLTRFVETAASRLRDGDVIGRLGGEEFGVLLPGCSREEARTVAERIREAFAASRVSTGAGLTVWATVSIGAVVSSRGVSPLSELMKAADSALYAAKKAGRNRVVLTQAAA